MEERRHNDGLMRERMSVLETKFDVYSHQMAQILISQELMGSKLDQLMLLQAERKGESKAAKFVWSALVAILGFGGGILGGIIKHG